MMNIELTLTIFVALTTAIIGPILVTRYKLYLESKRKKEDPVVSAIKANHLIDEQLEVIKEEFNADRVWLSQFHNGGNFYPTGKSIAKFTVMFEHVTPGVPGIKDQFYNIPVSLFNRSLMELHESHSIIIPDYRDETVNTFGLRSVATEFKTKSGYIFALRDLDGMFVGTMGIEYCKRAKKLDEETISELENKAVSLGTILSTYLYKTK
jgi:hypothetical protein